jgi:uncharacterized protein (DUF952 family)
MDVDERATTDARWTLLLEWDEELLLGGVILSERSTFLVQDADRAFCAGADLAALFAAQAAMESHLRYEYGDAGGGFVRSLTEAL